MNREYVMTEEIKGVDGDAGKLTPEHKQWLADCVTSGKSSARALGKKFNLKARVLQKYVARARTGGKFHSGAGRSTLLDSVSMQAIKTFVADNCNLSGDTLREKLEEEINKQRFVTLSRVKSDSKNAAQPAEVSRVSRRSMRRYVQFFLSE